MLLLDDSAKQKLDELGIPYGEYTGPEDIYLSFLLNVALDTAIRYNDAKADDPEVSAKYVKFIKDSDVLSRTITKLDKLSHDILNIICDATDGKHDEIMKTELEGKE